MLFAYGPLLALQSLGHITMEELSGFKGTLKPAQLRCSKTLNMILVLNCDFYNLST
jgi:hypothetical protein